MSLALQYEVIMRRDRNKAKTLEEENSKELMHAKLCNRAVQVKDS
jgi:hypothetical protein